MFHDYDIIESEASCRKIGLVTDIIIVLFMISVISFQFLGVFAMICTNMVGSFTHQFGEKHV